MSVKLKNFLKEVTDLWSQEGKGPRGEGKRGEGGRSMVM